jgi:hypothetical protein
MSQFTIALCFFIAILAMAGTVLVLTIIYFFRQTSNRSQAATSGTRPAKETGTPVTEKSAAPPVKPEKPARKNGFFWNRKKKAGKEQKEKVIPAVHTAPPAVEVKSPPLKVFKPQQAARLKTLFGGLFKTGGRKKPGKAKPTVNTTVYDSAVVAAVASPVAVPAEVLPKPAPEVNIRPALKPVTPVAAAAAPKFILPKKPVPVAGVNIDLPPVSVKNMMPGTPAAPVIGANDKNIVELTKPVAKEIKPEMGNKDVKQPEKPAAEKAPAPPTVKPPASPAPVEPKKVSEFSSLGDLSKMFAKEVVDDSEATKLAKNMKDVEISDLLKSGHDIADLLKRH